MTALNPSIPTIRLDDPDQEGSARKLRDACTNVGFFYLTGHGIPRTQLEAVLEQSKRLFDLSIDSKRALSDKVMSRGYTAMEEETLDPSNQTKGDTKEGFYIGRDIPESDPHFHPAQLTGPNQWPSPTTTPDMEDCQAFRTTMEDYYEQISAVGLCVVQLIAQSLRLDKHYFDDVFSEPLATLRLLHYDAQPSRPEEGIYACGAHTDYGMITLLLTDDTPGLQIFSNGTWIDAPPQPDAFVVNLGDMLERWTNGLYRSTRHRVLTANQERYSVPFFYDPAFTTRVECLPCCCSDQSPPKYPPTTSGQHLLNKYQQTHADFSPTNPNET